MRLKLPKIRPRSGIIIGILLVVILMMVLFIKQLQGPAEGTILLSPANTLFQTKMIHFEGKSIAFDYQSDLKQSPDSKPQPNVLEYYIFNKPASLNSPAAYLAITVYQLPSGKPGDNSAYALRKAHPELYTSRVLEINGSNFVIATKVDTREVTAFTVKDDKLAAISLTAALATSNELQSRFGDILNSWLWIK